MERLQEATSKHPGQLKKHGIMPLYFEVDIEILASILAKWILQIAVWSIVCK